MDFKKSLFIYKMKRILGIKFNNKHPSKKLIVSFFKLMIELDYNYDVIIVREHIDNCDLFKYAGYCQFLHIIIRLPNTSSRIEISTLPYDELSDMFKLTQQDYLTNWIEEENIL